MIFRKEEKVCWQERGTAHFGVLVRKHQDENRRNFWIVLKDDKTEAKIFEFALKKLEA